MLKYAFFALFLAAAVICAHANDEASASTKDELAWVNATPIVWVEASASSPVAGVQDSFHLLDIEEAGPPLDIWTRLRLGFALSDLVHPLVRKHETWYAKHPEYLIRMMERSRSYLYYIVSEVARRELPMELVLVPVIESAFNPMALSHARASGIWQFIPSTGKHYGLAQNWWIDERRDVIAATHRALDYLTKLYKMFGDWHLALAAYNCGEGAVLQAQRKNRLKGKSTRYADLKLPAETRNYVPKLQAVKNIMAEPERFGLKLAEIPYTPYFRTVIAPAVIDVKLAAEMADLSIEEFLALNPAHNRPVITGDQAQTILLPYDKVERFAARLDHFAAPLVSWQPYQLQLNEQIEDVANKFEVPVTVLKSVNGLKGRRKIPAGHILLVPAQANDDHGLSLQTAVFKSLGPEIATHRVRKGETLGGIAKRYELTVIELVRLNRLKSQRLRPGMRLWLTDSPEMKRAQLKPVSAKTKKKVKRTNIESRQLN